MQSGTSKPTKDPQSTIKLSQYFSYLFLALYQSFSKSAFSFSSFNLFLSSLPLIPQLILVNFLQLHDLFDSHSNDLLLV